MFVFIAELHVTSNKVLDIGLDYNHEKLIKEETLFQANIKRLILMIKPISVSYHLQNSKEQEFQNIHKEENGHGAKVLKCFVGGIA